MIRSCAAVTFFPVLLSLMLSLDMPPAEEITCTRGESPVGKDGNFKHALPSFPWQKEVSLLCPPFGCLAHETTKRRERERDWNEMYFLFFFPSFLSASFSLLGSSPPPYVLVIVLLLYTIHSLSRLYIQHTEYG